MSHEENKPLPPLSPLDNFMFAAGFQSMDAAPSAMSLVNAVLQNAGRPSLSVIDKLTCEQVLLGEGRKLRGCRLDLGISEGDHHYNIEAQLSSLQHMADRMIFNSNRMLSLNTSSGTEYDSLPKITVISLLNFPYRSNHPDFHQPFSLFYEKDPEQVTDRFDYHMIEIPKFREIEPDFSNPLHRWLYYLDVGYKDPDSPAVKEVFQMDQGLFQFAQQYQRNINDPETLNAYFGYMMECMDEKERISTARYEGRAEGRTEGRAEGETIGVSKMARKLKEEGMISLEEISRLSGLSVSEIEKL